MYKMRKGIDIIVMYDVKFDLRPLSPQDSERQRKALIFGVQSLLTQMVMSRRSTSLHPVAVRGMSSHCLFSFGLPAAWPQFHFHRNVSRHTPTYHLSGGGGKAGKGQGERRWGRSPEDTSVG